MLNIFISRGGNQSPQHLRELEEEVNFKSVNASIGRIKK